MAHRLQFRPNLLMGNTLLRRPNRKVLGSMGSLHLISLPTCTFAMKFSVLSFQANPGLGQNTGCFALLLPQQADTWVSPFHCQGSRLPKP